MHIGEQLLSNTNLFTPWIDRGADNALFRYEVITANNGATISVEVWHKNSEDTGQGAKGTGTFTEIESGVGVYQGPFSDLEELVRFEITVSANEDVSGSVDVDDVPSAGNQLNAGAVSWLLYRMLEPTWYDKA